jgi:ADP-ribose pyrophosphatase YjhB (NUDIX family)
MRNGAVFMIEVRVGVIVIQDNEVLLINHLRDGKRYWVLPGGKLRQVETLQECGEREVEEETSLRVKVTELLITGETLWPEGKKHIINKTKVPYGTKLNFTGQ